MNVSCCTFYFYLFGNNIIRSTTMKFAYCDNCRTGWFNLTTYQGLKCRSNLNTDYNGIYCYIRHCTMAAFSFDGYFKTIQTGHDSTPSNPYLAVANLFKYI